MHLIDAQTIAEGLAVTFEQVLSEAVYSRMFCVSMEDSPHMKPCTVVSRLCSVFGMMVKKKAQ